MKTEYVRVYEPKKTVSEKEIPEEKPKVEATKLPEKNAFEFVNNTKLLKDLKQNKGNIDKEKYFVMYKPKQANQEEDQEKRERERKLSQDKYKDDGNKNEKKSNKHDRKLHSSNTPEKDLKEEEPKSKFNAHFYGKEKEAKPNKNKPSIVKEYIPKK